MHRSATPTWGEMGGANVHPRFRWAERLDDVAAPFGGGCHRRRRAFHHSVARDEKVVCQRESVIPIGQDALAMFVQQQIAKPPVSAGGGPDEQFAHLVRGHLNSLDA